MKPGIKKRIFDIIQIGYKGDAPSRFFDMFISAVIMINITAMLLSTFDELSRFSGVFEIIELVTVIIFSIEYLLRLWTADLLYPDKSFLGSRIRFLFSWDGIVDLLTILPFYFLSGFIVFRMLRVVRIFRLFRINAQYDSFNVITSVLKERRNQIISSVFIILILMLASSIGMYSAEHNAQPEVFDNAFSGMWWSISTLLTVGYGDIYPVTVVGKIMAIIISLLGVGVVAVPTGIISAGFVEQYSKNEHSGSRFEDISEIGEIIGKTVGEIKKSYDMAVLLLLRGELTVLASEGIVVQDGDILIIRSQRVDKKQTKQKRSKSAAKRK